MPEVADPANTVILASFENHSVLAIKKVEFKANHVVDPDTDPAFPVPEWDSSRQKQSPVCYTRKKNVKLIATFDVMAPPTSTETVKVKGIAKLGSATLEWKDSVSVSPGSKEVTTGELTSSAVLPDEVACYDPATIEWEFEPPGVPPGRAGNSVNVMYVTLGDPKGTPAYWTLLDISCRAAQGATSAAGLIPQVFTPFTSRNLSRKRDDEGLKYWIPGNTRVQNTRGLLSGDGGGQCGSWAEFLIDMYKVHGENGRKIMIVVTIADLYLGLDDDPAVSVRGRGFLVKKWTFRGNGSLSPPFTHRMHFECTSSPIPGQRNSSPPPAFFNHYIVYAGGVYYDPSYGSTPVLTELQWENASIDGLFKGSACGYPKNRYLTTRLTEFH